MTAEELTKWQRDLGAWQDFARRIDARAKAVDDAIHNRGWALAASVGIPRDGCCLHNASIDRELKGWCHRNPKRYRVARQANYLVNQWPASRLARRIIAREYNKMRGDMACDILRQTSDGDDLSPQDLKLVEIVVNGFANETGESLFRDLHQRVINGQYRPEWLQGVEHLTRDHGGRVFWKGQEIEHWSGDLPYNAEGKKEAEELARRCKLLEEAGQPINSGTVVWNWSERNQFRQAEV